ncbi:MAG: response regulator [Lachnospiraceae bacterium]|nr:response regulator [Lachnospiraceae bacterium]
MKKILLAGEFSEVYRSVGEALSGEYQVQFCPAEAENVHGMVRLSNPDLIVVCMPGFEPLNPNIFTILNKKWSNIPVLLITTKENFEAVKSHCDDARYDVKYIPIKRTEIIEACHGLIEPELVKKQEEEPKVWFGERPDKTKKKVLVVDDAAIVLRNVKSMLDDKYEVLLAKSGAKALEIIADHMPNVVLLDYSMPEMDGKETFRKIREMVGNAIPVLFLTGAKDKHTIVEVLAEKPAGYILKPPDKDEIRKRIEQLIG